MISEHFSLSSKNWKIISLLLMGLNIAMISLTIYIRNWFKQELKVAGFDYYFYGGLTMLQSGNIESWESLNDDCFYWEETEGLCLQVHNYYYAGIGLIFFSTIAIAFIILACIIIIMHIYKHRWTQILTLTFSIISIALSLLCFLIGFISWAVLVKLQFGDCEMHKFPMLSPKSVCSQEGSIIAIVTIALLFFTLVSYYFIIRKIKIIEKKEEKEKLPQETMLEEL